MCGIAGIVDSARDGVDLPSVVRRMMAAQVHRGPDAEGYFFSSRAALGHRRLAIIDLSDSASQPMHDYSGRYVVTFNGEIYNFKRLRSQLKGYPFRTNSDTEVVLAAFAEWGEAAVERLEGQFAFAIWDARDEKLFLARDRLGEKPLYYHHCDGTFIFASELRALLKSEFVPKKLSREGLLDYLVHESVRSPGTMIADVFQVPPGHSGWFENGGLELRSYWSLPPRRREAVAGNYSALCRDIRGLLDEATDGQMISDVPIGAFLSGGIDSSAIVALMAQRSSEPVNTLSVTFADEQFDESRYSSIVSNRFETRHHVVRLQPEALLEELPNYFISVDAPSGDGPNTYIVSKAAKQAGLTVVLSGVGGDELFAGYDTFKRYQSFCRYGYAWKTPSALRGLAAQAAVRVFSSRTGRKAAALLMLEHSDAAGFYETNRSVFSRKEASSLLSESWRDVGVRPVRSLQNDEGFRALAPLSQMSVLELSNYMQNVLLKDTDAMAMANSLEVRLPFCNHRLVEYMLAVPDRFKVGRRPKQLLVDALGGLLPSEVVDRPKMGFAFPWAKWIRKELRAFCDAQLRRLGQRGVLDAAKIDALWRGFNSRSSSDDWSQIWLLVVLEQWLERCEL
jgi:asparagine synthase (glutamine-hydrolysing)